jgi:hypothetical protein
MKLTDEVQRALDDSGARVRFRFPLWLRPVVMRDIAAITVGRRIYVDASIAPEALERLLRHEIEHVRQISKVGFLRFYLRYGLEYVRNRRAGMKPWDAYRNVSFEREAFAAEDVHTNLDV